MYFIRRKIAKIKTQGTKWEYAIWFRKRIFIRGSCFFPNQLFWIIFWKLNRSEMIEILGDAIQYIVWKHSCLSYFEVTVIEALFHYLQRLNKVSLGRLFSKMPMFYLRRSRCITFTRLQFNIDVLGCFFFNFFFLK